MKYQVPKHPNGSCSVCARYTCDGECCEPGYQPRTAWEGLIVNTLAFIGTVLVMLAIGFGMSLT